MKKTHKFTNKWAKSSPLNIDTTFSDRADLIFKEEDGHEVTRFEIVLGGWYKGASVVRPIMQKPWLGPPMNGV